VKTNTRNTEPPAAIAFLLGVVTFTMFGVMCVLTYALRLVHHLLAAPFRAVVSMAHDMEAFSERLAWRLDGNTRTKWKKWADEQACRQEELARRYNAAQSEKAALCPDKVEASDFGNNAACARCVHHNVNGKACDADCAMFGELTQGNCDSFIEKDTENRRPNY